MPDRSLRLLSDFPPFWVPFLGFDGSRGLKAPKMDPQGGGRELTFPGFIDLFSSSDLPGRPEGPRGAIFDGFGSISVDLGMIVGRFGVVRTLKPSLPCMF